MKRHVEDEILVGIIADAGDSQSCSMGAIEAARGGDFQEANSLLQESQQALLRAHAAHTELISADAGQGLEITFIMVHASNHLSVAELSLNFAQEIVLLYQKIGGTSHV